MCHMPAEVLCALIVLFPVYMYGLMCLVKHLMIALLLMVGGRS